MNRRLALAARSLTIGAVFLAALRSFTCSQRLLALPYTILTAMGMQYFAGAPLFIAGALS